MEFAAELVLPFHLFKVTDYSKFSLIYSYVTLNLKKEKIANLLLEIIKSCILTGPNYLYIFHEHITYD